MKLSDFTTESFKHLGHTGATTINGTLTVSNQIMTTQESANSLKSRFLMGKDTGNTNDGDLYINYGTSHDVYIGAGGGSITNGSDSVFATVTSTGGGHGRDTAILGSNGGSGGGSGYNNSGTSSGTANQGFGGGGGHRWGSGQNRQTHNCVHRLLSLWRYCEVVGIV